MNTINPNQYTEIFCNTLMATIKEGYLNSLLHDGYSIISIQHTQNEDNRSRAHTVYITYGKLKQKELT
jgi:hypothetical protein